MKKTRVQKKSYAPTLKFIDWVEFSEGQKVLIFGDTAVKWVDGEPGFVRLHQVDPSDYVPCPFTVDVEVSRNSLKAN